MTATPEDLRATADARYAEIRNNPDLSQEAKRRAIAKFYLVTKAGVDKLKSDLDAATNGRQEALARQLYGIPAPADGSVAISYRDAQDRAGKAEDESAAIALVNRAMVAGDDLQVRALLEVGYSNAWSGVINAYTDRDPTKEAIAEELWDLTTVSGKPANNIFTGYLNYLTPQPPELSGLTDYVIQELAAGQAPTSQQFDA